MAKKKSYDVFISHSISDAEIAMIIARHISEMNLSTFVYSELRPPIAENINNVIWEALAECNALIAIISSEEQSLNSNIGFEIGAALAWNKPVYVIANGSPSMKVPSYLSQYPVYPPSRLDDIIREIQLSHIPLSEDEVNILQKIYLSTSVPTDQLQLRPSVLKKFTRQFNKSTKKELSSEQILVEMMRRRKAGKWPRLTSKSK